ncbi:hypothetical protein [Streptomyces curacoi]|uniref:hypothetical protein n=1 Tax=Streptomyces curacoi TaxID=146536 RepID=UPI00131A9151|nr:hypothetical protein [Streptomyces curacoi]
MKVVDLDSAYWEAVGQAGISGTRSIAINYISLTSTGEFSEVQLDGEPEVLNSAYQHFLAAWRAGIDEVGADVFGQALIDLGWSSDDNADRVTEYFRGTQQSVRKIAHEIAHGDFREIYRGAYEAAIISRMWARGGKCELWRWEEPVPVWVTRRDLRASELEWLLKIPVGFGEAVDIHHAMMANKDFADLVHEFLALPRKG